MAMAEIDSKLARRSFVRAENLRLGRFLDEGGVGLLVGWRRTYLCECGFRCSSPGEIFDHSQACAHKHETAEE